MSASDTYLPLIAGELLGHMERLREELLDLAGARHGLFVIVGKLVDAENRDDVLQILVALEDLLHLLRDVVVLLADDARIENAGAGGQRIDGRVNALLHQAARQVGGGIQVRERGGRRGIGIVVGGHVNGLHGRDGTLLGGRDALLQFAHFGGQVGLISHRRRHAAQQRRYFRTGLREAENIVDEQQHVLAAFIAEDTRRR